MSKIDRRPINIGPIGLGPGFGSTETHYWLQITTKFHLRSHLQSHHYPDGLYYGAK
jgi:hypothetical protein